MRVVEKTRGRQFIDQDSCGVHRLSASGVIILSRLEQLLIKANLCAEEEQRF